MVVICSEQWLNIAKLDKSNIKVKNLTYDKFCQFFHQQKHEKQQRQGHERASGCASPLRNNRRYDVTKITRLY